MMRWCCDVLWLLLGGKGGRASAGLGGVHVQAGFIGF